MKTIQPKIFLGLALIGTFFQTHVVWGMAQPLAASETSSVLVLKQMKLRMIYSFLRSFGKCKLDELPSRMDAPQIEQAFRTLKKTVIDTAKIATRQIREILAEPSNGQTEELKLKHKKWVINELQFPLRRLPFLTPETFVEVSGMFDQIKNFYNMSPSSPLLGRAEIETMYEALVIKCENVLANANLFWNLLFEYESIGYCGDFAQMASELMNTQEEVNLLKIIEGLKRCKDQNITYKGSTQLPFDINTQLNGWTLLMHATFRDCFPLVKILVEEYGASVAIKHHIDEFTAEEIATKKSYLEIAKYLHEHANRTVS